MEPQLDLACSLTKADPCHPLTAFAQWAKPVLTTRGHVLGVDKAAGTVGTADLLTLCPVPCDQGRGWE